ncbi:Cytochrome c oxidase subunit IV [Nakaseomyces glabratus]|nr:Cytochrome c oxidase subunit IV [Nakaseomyces glabratus]KAH7585738.1 Cytochrome c oxidase subunit IV [Nakaseomyces glabratus]KAH7587427.1 Cytochrome c oxidase subunit IV [Nakaseomyces glabratus]KAH7599370.1 Cytochrome c oxidase subunit IV [Nakaseomyces glabratus]KAH7612783.1 Cytochrome c oxidase subunit IV [Nakaseomyces glabratus]
MIKHILNRRLIGGLSPLKGMPSTSVRLGINYRLNSTLSWADEDEVYEPPNREIMQVPQKWSTYDYDLKEEIIEYLEWKQEDRWHEMSIPERRAAYYISFGEWGPRYTGQTKYDTSYVMLRALFNLILFSSAGMAFYNLKKDKEMKKKIADIDT